MKNLTKPQKAWGVATILLVLVSLVVFWPKGKEPIEPKRTHTVVTKTILIEYDVEYKLLSFGSVGAKLVKGKTIPAYMITFTYKGGRGTTRETIMVPKTGLMVDEALPINTVIWDAPIELEGKVYAFARWNPGYVVPARENPALVPEETLTREN